MQRIALSGARLARAQDPRVRRRLTVAFTVLWMTVAAHAVMTLSGLGRASATLTHATDLLYVAVSVVAAVLIGLRAHHVGDERAGWWWLTGAMLFFALGNGLWNLLYLEVDEPPYPSWADAAWIACYVPT